MDASALWKRSWVLVLNSPNRLSPMLMHISKEIFQIIFKPFFPSDSLSVSLVKPWLHFSAMVLFMVVDGNEIRLRNLNYIIILCSIYAYWMRRLHSSRHWIFFDVHKCSGGLVLYFILVKTSERKSEIKNEKRRSLSFATCFSFCVEILVA